MMESNSSSSPHPSHPSHPSHLESNHLYHPRTISIEQMRKFQKKVPVPIKLSIPNITLQHDNPTKKEYVKPDETIQTAIRPYFNYVSNDNICKIIEQLRAKIMEKAKSEESIEKIAEEVLECIMVSELNIANYMKILNSICSIGLEVEKTLKKIIIGHCFLDKCRNKIYSLIDDKYIEKLAQFLMDPEIEDEHNIKRDKINNLLTVICCLYSQRNIPTANIKVTSIQIYQLLNHILNTYAKLQKKIILLGDPNDGKCTNEDEWLLFTKMATLYAEQLYVCFSSKIKEFEADPSEIPQKKEGEKTNVFFLRDLVKRFKLEVVPTLTEEYLRMKCSNLF